MKTKIILLILSFTLVTPAFAIDATSSAMTREREREEMQRRIELEREKIQQQKEEVQKRIAEEKEKIQQQKEDLEERVAKEREMIRQQKEETARRIAEEKESLKVARASTTESIKEIKDRMREEIQEKINTKLDERRLKIAEGFERTLKAVKNLVIRTEARINKFEASSTDMTIPRQLLSDAKAKVVLAETELTAFENMLAGPIATSTRRAIIESLKIQSEKTKTAIKNAHRAIVETISSLKPGQREQVSTSTVATSTVN